MSIANPYDWRVIHERPGKRILARVDPATMELVICEEWDESPNLAQARQQREIHEMGVSKDFVPLSVIPQSVQSKAINEGWVNDAREWKRWMNDIDNRYLRITDKQA